jgi:hypothetical protein
MHYRTVPNKALPVFSRKYTYIWHILICKIKINNIKLSGLNRKATAAMKIPEDERLLQ